MAHTEIRPGRQWMANPLAVKRQTSPVAARGLRLLYLKTLLICCGQKHHSVEIPHTWVCQRPKCNLGFLYSSLTCPASPNWQTDCEVGTQSHGARQSPPGCRNLQPIEVAMANRGFPARR